jgi:hypothetical protein
MTDLVRLPVELQKAMRQGYQYTYGDGRRFTDEDDGFRVGPKLSNVPDRLSLTLALSRAERGRFDRFWELDTDKGKEPWLMPDPETDGWPELDSQGRPILLANGRPSLLTRMWLILFGRKPIDRGIIGVRSRLAIELMVMPP